MAIYTMNRGDTKTFVETIQPTNAGQQVLGSNGVQGWLFWLTVKHDAADPDSAAVFQKIPAQWSITQNGNTTTPGIAFVTILPTDTSGLPSYQILLQYDVQAKDTNGNIFTLESGTWIIMPDITQATS